jgi:hypothetical protein
MTDQKRQIDVIADILEREGKIDNFRCIHERISLRLGARIAPSDCQTRTSSIT